MTSAKIQSFCKKYNIILGVYHSKQQRILRISITERKISLFIHKNNFCLIWKTTNTNFTDAIKELENNFEYEANHNFENILKQVVEYKFPISIENIVCSRFFLSILKLLTCHIKNFVKHRRQAVII